jgi:uncharacterized membrane protein YbjE (DUF340 family)
LIRYILVALVCGVAAGYLNSELGEVVASNFVSYYVYYSALVLLLFVMGFAFSVDREAFTKLRTAGFKILIVPLSVALGSILGGIVSGLLLGINVIASTAVSAGYGWYTLAGPLVGRVFGAEWAALGFTVNFLRELLTIVSIPWMLRVDKYAPIASGGATTMDTTLPVIVRYCGSEALITAFASGFTLSIIAPFTIIAIASLR